MAKKEPSASYCQESQVAALSYCGEELASATRWHICPGQPLMSLDRQGANMQAIGQFFTRAIGMSRDQDDAGDSYEIAGSHIDHVIRRRQGARNRKPDAPVASEITIEDQFYIKATRDKKGATEWLVVKVTHDKAYRLPYKPPVEGADDLTELLGGDAIDARLSANRRKRERVKQPDTLEAVLIEVIPYSAFKEQPALVFERLKTAHQRHLREVSSHKIMASKKARAGNNRNHAELYESWTSLAKAFDDKPIFEAHPLEGGRFLSTLATSHDTAVRAFVQGHINLDQLDAADVIYSVSNWITEAGFAKTDKGGASTGVVTGVGAIVPAGLRKPTLLASWTLYAILEWHFEIHLHDVTGTYVNAAKQKIGRFRQNSTRAELTFDHLKALLFDYYLEKPQCLEALMADLNGLPGRALGLIWERYEERCKAAALEHAQKLTHDFAESKQESRVRRRTEYLLRKLTRQRLLYKVFSEIKMSTSQHPSGTQMNSEEFCKRLRPILLSNHFSKDPEGLHRVFQRLLKVSFRKRAPKDGGDSS